MHSTTIENPNLEAIGPVIDAEFLISSELEDKYKEEGKKPPEPLKGVALIDTGATCCMIQEEIPKKLGLTPVGTAMVGTAKDTGNECLVYWMKIVIPSCDFSYTGQFAAISLEGQDLSCLIGRDLLKNSIFTYSGNTNKFELSFF